MPDQHAMSVIDHLQELRRRLLVVAAAAVLGAAAGWKGQERLIDLFHAQVGRLAFFTPAELFVTKVRMACTIGLLAALPVFVLEAWRFVAPGLYPHEYRLLRRVLPAALCLLVLGLAFGCAVVYPAAVRFLVHAAAYGPLEPAVSLSEHFGVFLSLTLPFGLIFQVPLLLPVLARLGWVNPLVLRRRRRHVVFWSFLLAAVLTPPDVVMQFLLAVPLVFMFELGIRLARRAAAQREVQ